MFHLTSRTALVTFTVFALSIIVSAPGYSQDTETFQYVVKRNMGCAAVAKEVYKKRSAYKHIHAHNDLGPSPHRFKPGQVLILPIPEWKRPEAKLTRSRGDVDAKAPARAAWQDAQSGQELFRKWKVRSKEKASAEITFQDSSALNLGQNTVVIVYGKSHSTARRLTYEAELETGELRTRLGELAGTKEASALVVTTPASVAELSQSAAMMAVAQGGATLIANFEGPPAKISGRKKKKAKKPARSVAVKPGFGTKVEPGKDPEPPRPLPPTPTWISSPSRFATLTGSGTIAGSWRAVGPAERYRIAISTDAEGRNVTDVQTSPSSKTRFEVRALPPGTVYVSLSSIDADGLESRPSEPAPFTLVALEVEGAKATASDDGGVRVPLGAMIRAPERYTCALSSAGGVAPSDTVTITQARSQTLVCHDQDGVALAPLALLTESIRFKATEAGQPFLPTLAPGAEVVIGLDLDRGDLNGLRLEASATEPVKVKTVEQRSPTRWDVTLNVPDTTNLPPRIDLAILIGEASSPVVTYRLETRPEPGAVALEVVEEDDTTWVRLGAGFGWALGGDPSTLGTFEDHPRASLFTRLELLSFLKPEFEIDIGQSKNTRQENVALFGARGRLLLTTELFGLSPFLAVGGGVEYDFTDTVPALQVGGGLDVRLAPEFSLRLAGAQSIELGDETRLPWTTATVAFVIDL